MRNIFLFAILTLLVIKAEAQIYYSKIIPFNGNPNVANIVEWEDQFIISAISFIEDTAGSTFIILDSEFSILDEVECRGIASNNAGVIINEESLFVFGNNYLKSEFVTLKKFGENFTQVEEFNFLSKSEYNFTNTALLLNDHIYALTVDTYFNPERKENFLQKIDLEGNEAWNMTIGADETYTAGTDISMTESKNLLIGSIIILEGKIYSDLIKLDQQGNEDWRYRSQENTLPGYSSHRTVELTNKNLINISTVNRSQDVEFIINGWSKRPPKLSWLNSSGILFKDTLLKSSVDEHYTYSRIIKGQGDYFYICGNKQNLDFLSGDFGWLCKVSNDGEFIWNKKYHHPELKNSGHFHNIKTILELDNGDLIALGTAVKPGESQKIWTMRLNSDGCFDDAVCGDIPTSSNDLLVPTEKIKIYPNPSNGLIKFSINKNSKIDIKSIAVFNTEGKMVHSEIYDRQNHIDLSNLSKGLYFVQFTFSNGSSYLEKLILD